MLKLHGFALSNYYNMVKLALLEKALPFEEVNVLTTPPAGFKAISPRRKVPILETPQGFLTETAAILEYLEDSQGGQPLLPDNAFERAQVRSLARTIELYLELPARSCYPEAFFGGTVADAIKDVARIELPAGIAALRRQARFAPFVAGEQFTLADIYLLYSLPLAAHVAHKLFGLDLLQELPEARALLQRLGENPNVQRIAAERDASREATVALMKARLAR
ncbi:glutathione S-transferase family protein [Pseudomonas sp. ABC1]|uniref:glutathione S-transferase family protein n=1 Tax=Pseudomonas sp. ABC1 TaxID=2748080 RepID=UPI0015C37C15|nr:glutathione S-transferase [Pseudomonas sp. ABC1]QLF93159.1 glutathione S-transferase family protein [Pseudomonas sp. ABC1]